MAEAKRVVLDIAKRFLLSSSLTTPASLLTMRTPAGFLLIVSRG